MSKWVMQAHFRHLSSKSFQWYKELLNPLSFGPCNHFLKIWESTRTLTPKVEAPLEVWGFIPSHFPTLPGACDVTPELPSWPATLQAFTLVANPRLQLWHTFNYAPMKGYGNVWQKENFTDTNPKASKAWRQWSYADLPHENSKKLSWHFLWNTQWHISIVLLWTIKELAWRSISRSWKHNFLAELDGSL
jgi:hypothetical protein